MVEESPASPSTKHVGPRRHRRTAAVPNIRLSELFESNLALPHGPAADTADIGIDTKDEVGETRSGAATHPLSAWEVEPSAILPQSSSLPTVLSASEPKRGCLRSSGGSAGEIEGMNSRERRLKLKVSRGAIAKARRQTGRTSGASLDSHCSTSGPLNHDRPKKAQLEKDTITRNTTTASPGAATRRRSKHPTNPPSAAAAAATTQKPTAPNENENDILALFTSSHSRVNGKALRRLKKRFPDLGARFFAELQLPQVQAQTTGGVSITGRVGSVQQEQQQQRRSAGRFFRGRVVVWMRRARQAVTRTRSTEKG
ncbi:hypothetical protein C8A01DRAFT_12768 [Parachaetomium inaequale]|uniref:Uncharacterized protein n=1 Tax=Parachaetomium inaequale TaxID=2588326 RepID=A0AAN6PMP8_9PEZI|nr:hypothetical protein C8A01DRAFT_12768 [Parachaetomium inaequale]